MPFKIRRPLLAQTVFDLNGDGGAGSLGDFEPMQVKFHSCNGGAHPRSSTNTVSDRCETTAGPGTASCLLHPGLLISTRVGHFLPRAQRLKAQVGKPQGKKRAW